MALVIGRLPAAGRHASAHDTLGRSQKDDLCIGMRMDTHADMCMGMSISMCMDMHIYAHVYRQVHTYVHN